MADTGPKAHARLGASSAERWMNCPASIRLATGLPDTTSEFAEEGTAAHSLLEMALTRNLPPDTWLGTKINGFDVDEEMVEAVAVCTDWLRDLKAQHPDLQVWPERQFSLAALNPPAEMFGTSDLPCFSRKARKLWVPDYKHGKGVAVAALGNKQLRYYGLGALLAVEAEIGIGLIDEIELVIIQPRAHHGDGQIRSETLAYVDLALFADDLLEAAQRTLADTSAPKAGTWCRFCKASAICPAQHAMTLAVAQGDFIDTHPPAVETLTIEERIRIMEAKPLIEAFLKSVAHNLEGELNAGRSVPGYKLVWKRATRQWIDDTGKVTARLVEDGCKPEDYLEPADLKSVAQIEKLIGKKEFEQFTDLVVKESSGTVIVPESDKRPAAAIGAGIEFKELT